MKNLEKLKYFLGIEVAYSKISRQTSLSPKKCIFLIFSKKQVRLIARPLELL